jgi:hypothetical protein
MVDAQLLPRLGVFFGSRQAARRHPRDTAAPRQPRCDLAGRGSWGGLCGMLCDRISLHRPPRIFRGRGHRFVGFEPCDYILLYVENSTAKELSSPVLCLRISATAANKLGTPARPTGALDPCNGITEDVSDFDLIESRLVRRRPKLSDDLRPSRPCLVRRRF